MDRARAPERQARTSAFLVLQVDWLAMGVADSGRSMPSWEKPSGAPPRGSV